MVFKPIKPRFYNPKARLKDRRSASTPVKNLDKKMGHGKGNWGSDMDAQMEAESATKTETIETETLAMTVSEWEASQGIATDDKKGETTVRRSRKGYRILNIIRKFELRGSAKKEEPDGGKKEDPTSGDDKTQDTAKSDGAESKKPQSATTEDKAKEATSSTATTDVKAMASDKSEGKQEVAKTSVKFRFNKTGPAWGQSGGGGDKKEKLPSIKEILKQKSQLKGK